jgi:hypothetical protein
MLNGNAEGSLPSRMFGPMRKSSATGALAASSVVVPPFAFVIERGGKTRLLSRLSNINAPEDKRWSGRLRRFGGSFAGSTAGFAGLCPVWPKASDPTKSSDRVRGVFNIKTLAILLKYNNRRGRFVSQLAGFASI